MLDSSAISETGPKNVTPGFLLREESFTELTGHPDFRRYQSQVRNGEVVPFIRSEIMQFWTDKPLISTGFASCYSYIAVKPKTCEAQALHVSCDSVIRTSHNALAARISQWEAENVSLFAVDAVWSYLSSFDVTQLGERFQDRFKHIPLGVNSRFGIVYDPRKRILLVQLNDAGLLRTYQGF
jgi:hypothetical protein